MSVVLINPFVIEPAQESAFLENWRKTADVFADQPGYIDTRLHASLNPSARFRFVNIAHWTSTETWAAAMKTFPPKEGSQPGIQANPALYRLAPRGAVKAKKRSAEAEIEEVEQGLARAYQANDVGFLEKALADDYVVTDGPGTVSNKAKVLADHRDDHLKVSDFAFDEMTARLLSPDTAIVTGQYHWSATYDGRAIPGAFRYLRVYSRDDGWRIRAGQVTPIVATR